MERKRLVLIRIRGRVNVPPDAKRTFELFRLHKSNHCVFIPNDASQLGMIRKIKDFIAYGEITPELFEHLLLKWGRLPGKKRLNEDYIKENTKYSSAKAFSEDFLNFKAELSDIPNLKPVFRLHPPRKGLPRYGKKKHVKLGGALGWWGQDLNNLITQMS